MTPETLYKRTKIGEIQYWKVYTSGQYIFKESGRLGTENPVTHQEECTGKNIGRSNETTPHQQAESQALSDWSKKRDEGYKSVPDLIDARGFDTPDLAAWLDERLPKFNTDAAGNVKPMLATDWKKIKKIDYPVLIQPKLDGVRCLMIVQLDAAGIPTATFLSRSGKEYTTLGHIKRDVEAYAYSYLQQFILDGEIYSDELTFQEIIQAVKKQYPNSLKLHYRVYDVVDDETQLQRIATAAELVSNIGSEFIKMVKTMSVTSPEAVKKLHDIFVQDEGYEGAMLRLVNAKYEQGCRSRSLLKVKEFEETEFRARYFYYGQRKEDLLVMCETKSGAEFTAKMMGNRAQKEDQVAKHGIGQRIKDVITIKHFGWTTDGLPRHPVGRAVRDYE